MSASAEIRWSDEDFAILRRMAGQGVDAGEIADVIGVSKGAVQTMMTRQGVSRKTTDTQRERILELHRRGWRPSRIALQVDASEDVIASYLRSKGYDVVSKNVGPDNPITLSPKPTDEVTTKDSPMQTQPRGFGRKIPTPIEYAAMTPADRTMADAMAEEAGVLIFQKQTPRVIPQTVPEGQVLLGTAEIGGLPVGIDLAKLLDGRLLLQAVSGSGKSWTLRRILEQTADMIQQVIIDPEGEFRSLAELKGHHVIDAHRLDMATLATAASRVRKHRLSVLLDLSDMEREGQMQAVAAFLGGLIDAPSADWHPCLVCIDEAHLFAPFGDTSSASTSVRKASTAKMSDLMSRGRKRGLCGILATQRLARLSKSVSSEALNHLVGMNTQDLDVKRAADMIGWAARRAMDRLAMLQPGEFVAVGPAFSQSPCVLKVAGVESRHLGARPDLTVPEVLVDAAELLDLDGLVLATADDAVVLDEVTLPIGARSVRAFIREHAFGDAGRIWHSIKPLFPEGARLVDLEGHLEISRQSVLDAVAHLDRYGVVDITGAGDDRAVRITRGMN